MNEMLSLKITKPLYRRHLECVLRFNIFENLENYSGTKMLNWINVRHFYFHNKIPMNILSTVSYLKLEKTVNNTFICVFVDFWNSSFHY